MSETVVSEPPETKDALFQIIRAISVKHAILTYLSRSFHNFQSVACSNLVPKQQVAAYAAPYESFPGGFSQRFADHYWTSLA